MKTEVCPSALSVVMSVEHYTIIHDYKLLKKERDELTTSNMDKQGW